jgi:hypothetical protein
VAGKPDIASFEDDEVLDVLFAPFWEAAGALDHCNAFAEVVLARFGAAASGAVSSSCTEIKNVIYFMLAALIGFTGVPLRSHL